MKRPLVAECNHNLGAATYPLRCGGATMSAPILATSASPTGQIQPRDHVFPLFAERWFVRGSEDSAAGPSRTPRMPVGFVRSAIPVGATRFRRYWPPTAASLFSHALDQPAAFSNLLRLGLDEFRNSRSRQRWPSARSELKNLAAEATRQHAVPRLDRGTHQSLAEVLPRLASSSIHAGFRFEHDEQWYGCPWIIWLSDWVCSVSLSGRPARAGGGVPPARAPWWRG